MAKEKATATAIKLSKAVMDRAYNLAADMERDLLTGRDKAESGAASVQIKFLRDSAKLGSEIFANVDSIDVRRETAKSLVASIVPRVEKAGLKFDRNRQSGFVNSAVRHDVVAPAIKAAESYVDACKNDPAATSNEKRLWSVAVRAIKNGSTTAEAIASDWVETRKSSAESNAQREALAEIAGTGDGFAVDLDNYAKRMDRSLVVTDAVRDAIKTLRGLVAALPAKAKDSKAKAATPDSAAILQLPDWLNNLPDGPKKEAAKAAYYKGMNVPMPKGTKPPPARATRGNNARHLN